jgi:hypothetical protein
MAENLKLDWNPEEKPIRQEGYLAGYARGFELIFNNIGLSINYSDILGNIGQAFVIQGENQNKINGAVDIGWWPLEPLCLIRLNFLSQVTGFEINQIRIPESEKHLIQKDPNKAYQIFFKDEISRSLSAGNSCILFNEGCQYAITEQDESDKPLSGIYVSQKNGYDKKHRIDNFHPWLLLSIGKQINRIDRKTSDAETLEYIVALHTEDALYPKNPNQAKFNLQDTEGYVKWNWHTGRETLNIWKRCLEDQINIGEARWHANSFGHLKNNRIAAVDFLNAIGKRNSDNVSMCLMNAARDYEEVASLANNANPRKETIGTKEERYKLIGIIEEIMTKETNAVAEISKALKHLSN